MSEKESPFKSDYSPESQTNHYEGKVRQISVPPLSTVSSQTTSGETSIIPPVNQLLESERYGTGKPRRLVIRGKISRD